jgi:hypothetical protein
MRNEQFFCLFNKHCGCRKVRANKKRGSRPFTILCDVHARIARLSIAITGWDLYWQPTA